MIIHYLYLFLQAAETSEIFGKRNYEIYTFQHCILFLIEFSNINLAEGRTHRVLQSNEICLE